MAFASEPIASDGDPLIDGMVITGHMLANDLLETSANISMTMEGVITFTIS